MADGYVKRRRIYGDVSGSLLVGTLVGQTALLPGRPKYTICLQRSNLHASGLLAGATWALQDSTGVPITGPLSVATADTSDMAGLNDYGANGLKLTEGAGLTFVPSATGAAGSVIWEAYYLQTGVGQSTTIDRRI